MVYANMAWSKQSSESLRAYPKNYYKLNIPRELAYKNINLDECHSMLLKRADGM